MNPAAAPHPAELSTAQVRALLDTGGAVALLPDHLPVPVRIETQWWHVPLTSAEPDASSHEASRHEASRHERADTKRADTKRGTWWHRPTMPPRTTASPLASPRPRPRRGRHRGAGRRHEHQCHGQQPGPPQPGPTRPGRDRGRPRVGRGAGCGVVGSAATARGDGLVGARRLPPPRAPGDLCHGDRAGRRRASRST